MATVILAVAGLVITVLVHRRAVQINRRHDLPGPERGVANADPPVSASALRPGQAHVRTVTGG